MPCLDKCCMLPTTAASATASGGRPSRSTPRRCPCGGERPVSTSSTAVLSSSSRPRLGAPSPVVCPAKGLGRCRQAVMVTRLGSRAWQPGSRDHQVALGAHSIQVAEFVHRMPSHVPASLASYRYRCPASTYPGRCLVFMKAGRKEEGSLHEEGVPPTPWACIEGRVRVFYSASGKRERAWNLPPLTVQHLPLCLSPIPALV